MLLELHCRSSKHSACGAPTPLDLARVARAKALRGIVLTEYHCLWTGDGLRAPRVEAEVESHFVIPAGQEAFTNAGRVLVYGALFLDVCRAHAVRLPRDFAAQVRVFRARGAPHIAYSLIAVGKGDSADLKRVMREAENALARGWARVTDGSA